MALDLAAELIAALRSSSGREALAEALRPVVADELKRALDEKRQRPETLAEIMGVDPETARGRERRDPELRALAVETRGRRRLYLRHQVDAHLKARGR